LADEIMLAAALGEKEFNIAGESSRASMKKQLYGAADFDGANILCEHSNRHKYSFL
jgi:hypothetical protein